MPDTPLPDASTASPAALGVSSLPAQLAGTLRHLITAAGGGFVADGLLQQSQLDDIAGALVLLAGIAWSVWQKSRQTAKVVSAAQTGVVK